jgi:tellurite resistance protein TerC
VWGLKSKVSLKLLISSFMVVWISFFIVILIILTLDLGVFNKTPHVISTKEASKWTSIWVTLSLLFSGVIYWIYDNNYIANPDGLKPLAASIKFITGYLIELSLVWIIYLSSPLFFRPSKYRKIPASGFILGYSRGNRIQRLDDLFFMLINKFF